MVLRHCTNFPAFQLQDRETLEGRKRLSFPQTCSLLMLLPRNVRTNAGTTLIPSFSSSPRPTRQKVLSVLPAKPILESAPAPPLSTLAERPSGLLCSPPSQPASALAPLPICAKRGASRPARDSSVASPHARLGAGLLRLPLRRALCSQHTRHPVGLPCPKYCHLVSRVLAIPFA